MAQPKIPDYYFDLGLKQNATKREITVAFRRLSLQFHPDKNPGKEAEFKPKFIKIDEAYKALRDPEKRATYDVTYAYVKQKWDAYRHRDGLFKELRERQAQLARERAAQRKQRRERARRERREQWARPSVATNTADEDAVREFLAQLAREKAEEDKEIIEATRISRQEAAGAWRRFQEGEKAKREQPAKREGQPAAQPFVGSQTATQGASEKQTQCHGDLWQLLEAHGRIQEDIDEARRKMKERAARHRLQKWSPDDFFLQQRRGQYNAPSRNPFNDEMIPRGQEDEARSPYAAAAAATEAYRQQQAQLAKHARHERKNLSRGSRGDLPRPA